MQQILEGGTSLHATFAVNDAMALGVIHAVEAASQRVPEDVAVVGFDDLAWTALHRPALTTVHIRPHLQGADGPPCGCAAARPHRRTQWRAGARTDGYACICTV